MSATHSNAMRAGFTPARVVHLHASRFCNLACKHCYSASSPAEKSFLPIEQIIPALSLLKDEGYEILSLSGGEPLLFSGFETLVSTAKMLGFRINLISNGAPIGGTRLDLIKEFVSTLAISLDGAPETHVEIRGDKRAFTYVERALERLSTTDLRYGLSYCVSRKSLEDMPWVYEFAQERGVDFLQFHPFGAVGRGKALADQLELSQEDMARAYVVAKLLEMDSSPSVQVDIASVHLAQAQRNDYPLLSTAAAQSRLLSDLVNPLIIDETGNLLPFSYGINPSLSIGSIRTELEQSVERFKQTGWHPVRAMLEEAFAALDNDGSAFVDWYYHVVKTSFSQSRELAPHLV